MEQLGVLSVLITLQQQLVHHGLPRIEITLLLLGSLLLNLELMLAAVLVVHLLRDVVKPNLVGPLVFGGDIFLGIINISILKGPLNIKGLVRLLHKLAGLFDSFDLKCFIINKKVRLVQILHVPD